LSSLGGIFKKKAGETKMTKEKILKEESAVEKNYESTVCATSSIASWLIKSVIFTLLFLIFR
jgi:hypothetical protein